MSKNEFLSKFAILCWAAFIAILGHMQSTGHGLDTTASILYFTYIMNWISAILIMPLIKALQ